MIRSRLVIAVISAITLSASMSNAAISPDARNARNAKAVHFTVAVNKVSIAPKEAQVDGDQHCRVDGQVVKVNNDGSSNSWLVFSSKPKDKIMVELGCHSASYNTAPGALRVSSDEIKEAKTIEFWGQMVLMNKDGSFIDSIDAMRMTPEAWRKYTEGRTPVFMPFDINIVK